MAAARVAAADRLAAVPSPPAGRPDCSQGLAFVLEQVPPRPTGPASGVSCLSSHADPRPLPGRPPGAQEPVGGAASAGASRCGQGPRLCTLPGPPRCSVCRTCVLLWRFSLPRGNQDSCQQPFRGRV